MEFMTQPSGGWFVLAFINAGLAEQKNRSRLNWFLLSLLFGPFATAYIVLTAKPGASAEIVAIEPQTGLWLLAGILLAAAFLSGIFAFTTSWLWFIAAGCVVLAVTAGLLARKIVASEAMLRSTDEV